MMLHKKLYVLIFIFAILNCFSISFIQNGETLPSFLNPVQGGYSLSVGIWNQAEPIFAEIVKSDGTTIQINSNYKSWDPATQTASSTFKSVRGTVLVFDDILSLASDGLLLNRTVTVQAVGKGEVGFSTRFSLESNIPSSISDNEFFMPGIWYKNNIDAPDLWFGKNPSSKYVLVREDRIPYPLIMSRNPTTSNWATLVNIYPNGTTIENDVGRSRIIDSRFQYGSIGVINSEKLELAYQFPASEGSTTSVGGLS